MMTVHAAKGLEFPVVFVIGIAPQRFPQREQTPVIEFPNTLRRGPQPPRDIHLQEERRLFYVAMTRAEERLYLSSLVKAGRKPSVFVDDLLSNAVVRARDIERIQVAAIPAGGTAAVTVTPPRTPPQQPPGLVPTSEGSAAQQPSLFDALPAPVRAFYPELESWARQPVVAAPDGKLRLSATSIEDYLNCPLKFKLNYFLKVPTGPQGPLTFGSIMHRSVRHYFVLRKKFSPGFEDLKEFYLGAWRDAGFEDSYQEQAYKRAGLEQLRRFVEVQGERPIRADEVRLEESFKLDLGDVVLEGRIDQIHPLAAAASQGRPASRPECELVDYKTGKPRSQHDADQSLQLSIYALAARRLLGIEPARLTFYNLTNNEPVSTTRTERGLEVALVKVREVAENVRRLLFDPTPGFVCRHCDFVPLCPAHEEIF
jgi:DNA helicase-2/ATP-dependent DNA helicase PcrA